MEVFEVNRTAEVKPKGFEKQNADRFSYSGFGLRMIRMNP